MTIAFPLSHFHFSMRDDPDRIGTYYLSKCIVLKNKIGVDSHVNCKDTCIFFSVKKLLMYGVEVVIIIKLFPLIIIFIEFCI